MKFAKLAVFPILAISLQLQAPGQFTPAPALPNLPIGPTFSNGPTNAPAAPVGRQTSAIFEHVRVLLGPLGNDLYACFSMDGVQNGSLLSQQPPRVLNASFQGPVAFVGDAGRQCVSFASPGSKLLVSPDFDPGPAFTLAGWIRLPVPNGHAVIWQSRTSTPLYFADEKFMCWKTAPAEFCTVDASLTGWRHVAVACDGQKTLFYLDGAFKGEVAGAQDGGLSSVGNNFDTVRAGDAQCDLIDDVLVFNRALSGQEIAQVMKVRVPIRVTAIGGVRIPPGAPAPFSPIAPVVQATPAPVAMAQGSRGASESISQLIRDYRNSLVFVRGDNGAGSGFLATMGKANFLVTNAHVAAGVKGAGFQTLDGKQVQVGAPAAAVGHDIFVMQTSDGGKPFDVMYGVEQKASIGDEVVVLGNAEGANVINSITGRIVGIGDNLVEVDAPFVPGNSGSPIIHLKSGKVIAVATYLTIKKYDPATRQVFKEPVVRRFGYRIDSVKTWQPVNWAAFAAQAAEMEKIEKLTQDFVQFLNDLSGRKKLTASMTSNPVIQSRVEWWESQKREHMSAGDRAALNQNFVGFLKTAAQADVTSAKREITYDYFVRGLEEQQKARNEISDVFAKLISEMQAER